MKEELEIVVKDNGAKKTIGEIRKELKESREEMLNLEPGSKAFLQAAKNAGELQHQLTEINDAVKGASSDFGDMVGNVAKVGAGITGAFLAAKGTMALFGAESEDVAKAIEKMQSMMAMTQGLSSIDEGIKSFKKLKTVVGLNNKELGGFKKALIGTGLGALVVLLGSVIANWDEFTAAIGLSEKQMNKFGEVAGGVMNVLKGSIKTITLAITKAVTGDWKGAVAEIKGGLDITKLYAEGVQGAITKREEAETKKRLEANKKYVDKMEAEYDRQRSKAEATIQDELKLNEEIIRIEQDRLKLYKEGTKEYYDQLKTVQDLEAKEANRKEKAKADQEAKDAKDAADKLKKDEEALNIRLEQNKRLEQSTKERVLNEITIEQERLLLLEKGTLAYEQQLTKIKELQDSIKESVTDWTQVYMDAAANASYQLADVAAQFDTISTGWADGFNTLGDTIGAATAAVEVFGDKNADAGKKAQAGMQVAATAAAGIGNLLNNIAQQQDKNSKEGFEKSKKLQIGAAVMNTLSGVLAAWVSALALPAPASFILGGILTAATAAMGAAQIANIKKQKFESSGGDAGASANAAAAHVSTAAAHINSPVQFTQDVQGASIESAIKDTRVYVTESDISDTLSRVNVAESENRY